MKRIKSLSLLLCAFAPTLALLLAACGDGADFPNNDKPSGTREIITMVMGKTIPSPEPTQETTRMGVL